MTELAVDDASHHTVYMLEDDRQLRGVLLSVLFVGVLIPSYRKTSKHRLEHNRRLVGWKGEVHRNWETN